MSPRLVAGITVLNLALSAALVMRAPRAAAASAPETLRARAIELLDERGQVRAQINVEPSGETVLRLRDAKGEVRVKLGAGGEGSGLLLLDGATEPGVQLLARSGGSSVSVTGPDGRKRLLAP
jgi:hypothetical protein